MEKGETKEKMPTTKQFKKLFESVEDTYLGDTVPKKYRKSYGKIYNKKDIKPLAIRIAKSRGIKIE